MKKLVFFLLLGMMAAHYSSAQVIVTFAGTGTPGHLGDYGPATAAELFTPSGVCADTSGNIYITDQNNNCVREVDTAGIIFTVAGICGHTGSFGGDGGPATAAFLYFPEGVGVDKHGNIYIADQFNDVIRKVDKLTGNISTIAGTPGYTGYSASGVAATDDTLWHPADVAVDDSDNVYFVDQNNGLVRKIWAATGIMTNLAGIPQTLGYNGDGIAATAAKLNQPQGIASDSAGNIYIADFYNSRIRKVGASGIITTVAGNGTGGYTGDGIPATNAEIWDASAVAVDKHGNIYISDYYNSRIRKVDTGGIITTLTGDDTSAYRGDCGPATAGEIYWPEGVAVDKAGNVYIADFNNARVREITDSAPCASVTTAVNTPVSSAYCEIFPNPSDGQFNIIIKNGSPAEKIEVYNLIGETVYTLNVDAMQTKIDLSSFVSGFYFICVRSENGVFMQKVLLSH